MRTLSRLLPFAVSLAPALAACGGGARPATPAPVAVQAPVATPAPVDSSAMLVGHWTFSSQLGGESYGGTMDVTRDAGVWKARVAEANMGELQVQSVSVQGTTISVIVHAGDGLATVMGTLQPDGTLAGKVQVSGGEGTFSAKKG